VAGIAAWARPQHDDLRGWWSWRGKSKTPDLCRVRFLQPSRQSELQPPAPRPGAPEATTRICLAEPLPVRMATGGTRVPARTFDNGRSGRRVGRLNHAGHFLHAHFMVATASKVARKKQISGFQSFFGQRGRGTRIHAAAGPQAHLPGRMANHGLMNVSGGGDSNSRRFINKTARIPQDFGPGNYGFGPRNKLFGRRRDARTIRWPASSIGGRGLWPRRNMGHSGLYWPNATQARGLKPLAMGQRRLIHRGRPVYKGAIKLPGGS